jgi:hypothetical protein
MCILMYCRQNRSTVKKPRLVSNSDWPYDMAREVVSFSVVLTVYAREGEGIEGPGSGTV